MNNNNLKQQLLSLTYNDETDAVTLRYVILQLLVQYAEAYKKIAGTGEGFELLQQFKKLETAHADFKEKYRNNSMTEYYFSITREVALQHILYRSTDKMLKHAA